MAENEDHAPLKMLSISYPYHSTLRALPILSADQTTKLSRAAFDQICAMGNLSQRPSGLLLLDIHDHEVHHYPYVSAVIRWASEGSYPPGEDLVLARSRVQIRGSTLTVPYHPSSHYSYSLGQSDDSTYKQFRCDIQVYAFAKATGMAKLQLYARTRLMWIRPIFVAEVRLILSVMGPQGLRYLAKKDPVFAEFVFVHVTRVQQQFNDHSDRDLLCGSVSAESAGLAVAEQILGKDWRRLIESLYGRSSQIVPFLLKMLYPYTANMDNDLDSAGVNQNRTTSSMAENPLGSIAVIGAIVRERVVFATKAIGGMLVYDPRTANFPTTSKLWIERNQFLILLADEGESSLVMDETGAVGRIPWTAGTRSVCGLVHANDAPSIKKRRAST
ncbi:hypothetical protein CERZMDRAFT_106999 [Cercospora zeae-maydis SCOH1-5]|uniref:Uncharacterized protein n=1 Tax=Cercospora zeae-maydis SCOH1-5 TaxID=717836 RepID=A0A6A6F5E0_9PEZI|nr:hypothetical protein CERZMDRAFT_106999 [Cercospora zeae-maydis SCOH1-5]